MKNLSSLKGVLIVLVLAVLIVTYSVHMSNLAKGKEDEGTVKTDAVTELLQRNLTTNYPQTPKEVIKYFSEITQCYYNEEYTDEQLILLADQMLKLYDPELANFKSHDDYIQDLKDDIAEYKFNNYTISSFAPS